MSIPCANCCTRIEPTYTKPDEWGHSFACCCDACGRGLTGRLRRSAYYAHVKRLEEAQAALTESIERMRFSIQFNSIYWQSVEDDGK